MTKRTEAVLTFVLKALMVAFALLFCGFCGLVLRLFIEFRVLRPAEFESNKEKWLKAGISSYTITIESPLPQQPGTIITVRDSEIVSIENHDCVSTDCDFRLYEQWTVDGWFAQAEDCIQEVLCPIHYDPEYGFPTSVGMAFLEGVPFRVLDFEPLYVAD